MTDTPKHSYIDVVFDGPPGPVAGRFIEVENPSGASIRCGDWIERPDGRWVLRIYEVPEYVTGVPAAQGKTDE